MNISISTLGKPSRIAKVIRRETVLIEGAICPRLELPSAELWSYLL